MNTSPHCTIFTDKSLFDTYLEHQMFFYVTFSSFVTSARSEVFKICGSCCFVNVLVMRRLRTAVYTKSFVWLFQSPTRRASGLFLCYSQRLYLNLLVTCWMCNQLLYLPQISWTWSAHRQLFAPRHHPTRFHEEWCCHSGYQRGWRGHSNWVIYFSSAAFILHLGKSGMRIAHVRRRQISSL